MSKQSSLISVSDTGLSLTGPLQFDTVAGLLKQGQQQLAQTTLNTVVIDLEKVNRIDSAGVSLLLEWKRQLESLNKTFVLKGLQEQVLSLLKTYKLQDVLVSTDYPN